jgi:hypothetical protein
MEFLGTIILLVYFLVKWIISILPFVAIAVFAVWAINMFTKPKTVHVIVDEPKSLPHGEMSQEQVESECIGAAGGCTDRVLSWSVSSSVLYHCADNELFTFRNERDG